MRGTALTMLVALALGAASAGAAQAKKTATKTVTKTVVDACWSDTPQTGVGALDPFRPPAAKAVELNAAAKVPYRQGKWEEARAQYRAALAADPDFLAPQLNIACAFVRQDRFAEAEAEVIALLDHAYVPWAREISEAADLGALKVRPEMKDLQRAMVVAAARWGEGLGVDDSVLFVARQRPPLRVPDGPGVFLLNPHQEVWAFTPRTRRYRQLTAEDGHVVAFARALDGRRILYVTAEKLVRGARPDDVALRGVAVRELTLATMTLGPAARVEGDVRRLAIYADLFLDITSDHGRGSFRLAAGLVPTGFGRRPGEPVVALTGGGVEPTRETRSTGRCTWVARDQRAKGEGLGVELARSPSAAAFKLAATAGAALYGLPIP